MFAEFIGGPMAGQTRDIPEVLSHFNVAERPALTTVTWIASPFEVMTPIKTITYVLHIHTRTFAAYVLESSDLAAYPVNHDVFRYFRIAELKLEDRLSDWAQKSRECRMAALSTMFCFQGIAAVRMMKRRQRMQQRKEAAE
jgi:hypothetical protein